MGNNGDKKIILFGAGRVGLKALVHFGSDRVFCFADNNTQRELYYICKEVITFEKLKEIHKDYRVVITTTPLYYPDILAQCEANGIPAEFFGDIIGMEDYDPNPAIAQYKDAYKGKRCFIIGNGPSLTAGDLDKIHGNGDISFACNGISYIFDQTDFRPTFYMSNHINAFKGSIEKLRLPSTERIFLSEEYGHYEKFSTDVPVTHFILMQKEHLRNLPFSSDAARCVYCCATIVYPMMQLAAYMGFDEIFLLGLDNTPSSTLSESFGKNQSHFYSMDIDKNSKSLFAKEPGFVSSTQEIDDRNRSFISAKEYADRQGIKIFNATRGGYLEVFERAEFDRLF